MAKDYYQTLGVSRTASQEEIKQAFRKLAHQHHPDKPGGDAEKFKEINEAYQVLGDKDKRTKYDQFGSGAFDGSAGFNGSQGFGGQGFDFSGFGGAQDLGEMFGDIFGFGGGRRSEPARGRDLQVEVTVTFQEAVFGVGKEITLTKSATCERCAGMGAEPGTKMKTCKDCDGKGIRIQAQRTILGTIQRKTSCRTCAGSGEIPETPCTTCGGLGVQNRRQTFTVKIPEGMEDGDTLRLRGEGEAVKGSESGDLFVRVRVKADPRFERDGTTIISRTKIGFTQAALGDTLEVETVDNPVELKIPAGTQSGTQFRLRGKGVPSRRGRGDQIVIVEVITPTKLSKEQKKLMEELGLSE